MSANTSIEWTATVNPDGTVTPGKTWNPVRGCSVISPGCVNCYAMKQAHRFSGEGRAYAGLTKLTAAGPQWTGKIQAVESALLEPLTWRKPARVFVNSMSDLFHEAGLEKFGGPDLQPFLVVLRNNQTAQSIDGPVPTLTTSGANVGVAQPFLVAMEHGGRLCDIAEPLPTITTARGGAFGVVDAFVLGQQSGSVARSVDEPFPTVATDGAIAVVQPCIVQTNERRAERVGSVDDPLKTITAMGGRCFGLAEPFLVPFYGERDGQIPRTHGVDQPLPTLPCSPKFGVVEPYLTKYNRTATGAYSVDEPLDTVTARDRFGLVQPVVDGYVLDIHFRMLQPHELAAAMSFPKSYQFTGNREAVVKQIGNSWAGELSKALCLAAVRDFAGKSPAWRTEATA